MVAALGFASCSRTRIPERQVSTTDPVAEGGFGADLFASAEGAGGGAQDWLRPALCGSRARCDIGKTVGLSDAHDDAVVDVFVSREVADDAEAVVEAEQWLVNRKSRVVVQLLTKARARGEVGKFPMEWAITDSTYQYKFNGNGPSNWMGTEGATIDLETRTVTQETHHWYHRFDDCAVEDGAWDPRSFTGNVEWSSVACKGAKRCVKYRYAVIPDVTVDAGFARGGWKNAGLASCAMHLGGDATAVGDASGAASLRVVRSGAIVFAEVQDARLRGRPESSPRLIVWTAETAAGYMDQCRAPSPAVSGWAIRLPDGAVQILTGDRATSASVSLSETNATIRIRMELPSETWDGLSVAYSYGNESDTSALASSHVVADDAATIGSTERIPDTVATCVMSGGALVIKAATSDKSQPLYSPE
jgi:hypothetical protein